MKAVFFSNNKIETYLESSINPDWSIYGPFFLNKVLPTRNTKKIKSIYKIGTLKNTLDSLTILVESLFIYLTS